MKLFDKDVGYHKKAEGLPYHVHPGQLVTLGNNPYLFAKSLDDIIFALHSRPIHNIVERRINFKAILLKL